MLRAKLLYLVLVAGLTIFYVLYIDSMPLLFLSCVLLLPLLLKASVLWLHFCSDGAASCQIECCTAEDPVPVVITLDNRCPLFFSRGEAVLRIRHSFGRKAETMRLHFPVRGQNTTRLTFYLHADRCGSVEIRLMRLRVYDLFRMFHTNVPLHSSRLSLLVLPRPLSLPVSESAPPVPQPESIRYEDKPGDDPSELFGIREYVPGDAVSRIHWKLSLRSDKLMIRELGSPVEQCTLLLAEFLPEGGSMPDVQEAEHFLAVVYSLAMQLITLAHPFVLSWYDGKRGEQLRYAPDSREMLADTFRELYQSLLVMGPHPDAIRETFGEMAFSSSVVITNAAGTGLLHAAEEKILANQHTLLLVREAEKLPVSDLTDICMVLPGQACETIVL